VLILKINLLLTGERLYLIRKTPEHISHYRNIKVPIINEGEWYIEIKHKAGIDVISNLIVKEFRLARILIKNAMEIMI
jgi:hypothetical protein